MFHRYLKTCFRYCHAKYRHFHQPQTICHFQYSIFHLEEKVTNYLFILHSKINKIASRADDVIKAHGHYTLVGSPT